MHLSNLIVNRVRRHLSLFQLTGLWLSSTSNADKYVRLYVAFEGSRLLRTFLYKDADIQTKDKQKCIICRHYDKVLVETGKFPDILMLQKID